MSTLAKLGVLAIIVAIAYHVFFKPAPVKITQYGDTSVAEDPSFSMFAGEARVIKVTDGVYVARQFSVANMAMIEGSDGIIIIDSTASSDSALKVLEEFRNITDKPIRAIILTHFHPDHISGLNSILQSTKDHIDVYSHRLTKEELSKSLVTKQGTAKRTARQFGMMLPSTVLPDIMFTAVHPTYTYEKQLTVHIAGVKVELIHTPGETEDHTSIFLPEKNVLFPGDNLYESFPNIYPVRGEIRDVKQWISSLDRVRYLNVTYLAPSHITPVIGREQVWNALTTYRDAMQFVYDQTIRCMNKQMHLDDIVRTVKLPSKLHGNKNLRQSYGTVEWSVRSIYGQQVGWFTSYPEDLTPLSALERAEKFNELLAMGGQNSVDKMIQSAEKNLDVSEKHFQETGFYPYLEAQWALEISAMALRLSEAGGNARERATATKIKALQRKAKGTSNWTAKNYYLSCVAELDGTARVLDTTDAKNSMLSTVYIEDMMALFPRRFKAEECDPEFLLSVGFYFSDLEQDFVYLVRNCVVEMIQKKDRIPETLDAKATMTSEVWRDLAKNTRSGVGAYMSGDLVVEGSMMSFQSFFGLFDN